MDVVLCGLLDISCEKIILLDVVLFFWGFEQVVRWIEVEKSFNGKHFLQIVKRLEFLDCFCFTFWLQELWHFIQVGEKVFIYFTFLCLLDFLEDVTRSLLKHQYTDSFESWTWSLIQKILGETSSSEEAMASAWLAYFVISSVTHVASYGFKTRG